MRSAARGSLATGAPAARTSGRFAKSRLAMLAADSLKSVLRDIPRASVRLKVSIACLVVIACTSSERTDHGQRGRFARCKRRYNGTPQDTRATHDPGTTAMAPFVRVHA